MCHPITFDGVLKKDIPESEFSKLVTSSGGSLLYFSQATNPPTVLVRFPNEEKANEFKSKEFIHLIS